MNVWEYDKGVEKIREFCTFSCIFRLQEQATFSELTLNDSENFSEFSQSSQGN